MTKKITVCFSSSLETLKGLVSSDLELLLPRYTPVWGGEVERCDAVRLYEPNDSIKSAYEAKGIPVEDVAANDAKLDDVKPKAKA